MYRKIHRKLAPHTHTIEHYHKYLSFVVMLSLIYRINLDQFKCVLYVRVSSQYATQLHAPSPKARVHANIKRANAANTQCRYALVGWDAII